jgi:hypothetical protein
MPSWPIDVSHEVVVDAFRVLEITRPAKWTEFEDGPPLARKSGAGRRAKLAYRIVLGEREEMERFRHFFEADCADGTARFTMPVWNPANGLYEHRTVMFDQGQATIEPFGLGWSINFTLIVFNW